MQRVMRVEHVLLTLLQVLVVCGGQTFHRHDHTCALWGVDKIFTRTSARVKSNHILKASD